MSWGCTKRHLLVAAFIEQGIQHPKLRCVWGWCWSSDILPRKYGLGLGKIHPHKWLCFENFGSRMECFALNNQKWNSHPSGGIWLRWLIEIHCICIYFDTFPRHLFSCGVSLKLSQPSTFHKFWQFAGLCLCLENGARCRGFAGPTYLENPLPLSLSLYIYIYIHIIVW